MSLLTKLVLMPSYTMSRRALASLAQHEGIVNLRALEGVSFNHRLPGEPNWNQEQPLIDCLRNCVNLERLEVIGHAIDLSDVESAQAGGDIPPPLPTDFNLVFPNLNVLTLLSTHSSLLMLHLLSMPLPSLQHLTLTPYDDIPYPTSLVSQFVHVHGASLRSLSFLTPKSWPTRLHPSPSTMLQSCPNLRHLSLETPLPRLIPPTIDGAKAAHLLHVLSIPRPTDEFWSTVLSPLLPYFPALKAVRIRDVRWLRKGLHSRASATGVQGNMRDWQARLHRRNIMLLDADWNA
jgi:hypothetical protein